MRVLVGTFQIRAFSGTTSNYGASELGILASPYLVLEGGVNSGGMRFK